MDAFTNCPIQSNDSNVPRFNFSKKNRLLKSSEFSQVFSEGKKVFFRGLMLIARISKAEVNEIQKIEPKIGFALSKKMLKLACRRKRLKRLAIEFFRLNKAHLVSGEFVLTLLRSFQSELLNSSKEMNQIFTTLWSKALRSHRPSK